MVERIEFLGAEALVHCRAEGIAAGLIARMAPEAAERLRGMQVLHATAAGGALLAFDDRGQRVARADVPAMGQAHAG